MVSVNLKHFESSLKFNFENKLQYFVLLINFQHMKAVEFKTKLKNNRIHIPKKFQKQVTTSKNQDVRVIVLMDEPSKKEKDEFQYLSKEQFLKGYDKSDSVYDRY